MNMLTRLALTSSAMALGFALAGPAFSQSSPEGGSNPTLVHGVVVTARPTAPSAATATKTDAPVMETPLNVQVVTSETLEDQGVVSLDQALRNVSGVTVGAGGGAGELDFAAARAEIGRRLACLRAAGPGG